MGAAFRQVVKAFGEVPVDDSFWRQGYLAVLVIGFKQVTDIEAYPLANAPRNDDLKFGFYGDEFHGWPVG